MTLDDWFIHRVKLLVPGDPARAPHDVRLMLVLSGEALPLKVSAAQRGFRNLNTDHLRHLFNYLQVPYQRGQKPRTKEQLLTKLLKHLPPDAEGDDENRVLEIVQHREGQEEMLDSEVAIEKSIFTEAELKLLHGDEEDDWLDEVHEVLQTTETEKHHQEKRRARIAEQVKLAWESGLKGGVRGGDGDVTGGEPAASSRVRIPRRPTGYLQREAKKFLPPRAYISKSLKGKSGRSHWQAKGDFLVNSISRDFVHDAAHDDDNAALFFVLEMTWYEYCKGHPDVQCPYIFVGAAA